MQAASRARPFVVIESVPNVSEGRRRGVVEALAAGLRSAEGVHLLDYSADASHNRSVFTVAGESDALGEAMLALVGAALSAIDLRSHRGAHPRLGAVDVIPFIPLGDATMEACVTLAETVGRAIADRYAIPVYLYEEAARDPKRKRLEDVRRGQFEGLARRMALPGWAPDFGPASPHPTAGATAVGARHALIAFNVNLSTDRLDVARRIAAAVRERGGGLPSVKAMGVSSDGRGAQVSMNLTDYRQTSIGAAFDRVVAEAAREGIGVAESELIGLIPAAALAGTDVAHLKLRHFSEDRILEHRLRQAGFGQFQPLT